MDDGSGASPPASPSARALWSDAAEALKKNDRVRAERALAELTASSDAVTRDSAELALIELWMKSGQTARGRGALARLAASGATPAIRNRARNLAREPALNPRDYGGPPYSVPGAPALPPAAPSPASDGKP